MEEFIFSYSLSSVCIWILTSLHKPGGVTPSPGAFAQNGKVFLISQEHLLLRAQHSLSAPAGELQIAVLLHVMVPGAGVRKLDVGREALWHWQKLGVLKVAC